MRISDWSSDVCSSDLARADRAPPMGSGRCGGGGRGGAARMTMALLDPPLALRTADLDDATECARIDAFVHDHRGTTFHFTGWSRAVERGCGQGAHYLVAETADGASAGVLRREVTKTEHQTLKRTQNDV